MKKIIIIISIIIINFPVFSGNQDFEQKFKQANELYSQNKFEDALNLYQEIIDANYVSENLFYNMANTCYRLNKIGESIYYYEKALMLNPSNEDAKYNLDLANLRVKNRPAILPQNAIASFFKDLIFFASANFWAYLALFLFIVFLVTFFIYIKSQTSKEKKLYFLVSIIILFFSISSMIFMQYQTQVLNSHNIAIVIENEADAKSSPDEKSNTLFKVYEGFKVEIENKNGAWAEIKLTDGKKAWIKNEYLKTL
ncbi:MAG: tetratricopeptide repeat protein [Chlorobi bacterium]|nr:tetratricopeptide repeat protein [Chlorobiota bacterium]